MHKTTIVKKLLITICSFAFLISIKANAQIVIGTPSLGFSQACASESFNTYYATFTFSPATSTTPSLV